MIVEIEKFNPYHDARGRPKYYIDYLTDKYSALYGL